MGKEIESIQNVYNLIINFFVNYSFQIVGAIIIIVLGFFVAKKIAAILENFCLKKNLDITLTKFITTGIKITIIVGASIIALGKIGITLYRLQSNL